MSKDKWVRRFSVDETHRHKDGFTIYKITSFLFPIQSPEAMTVVSVWKRYSDVQRLHASMKALHAGLHLRGVFPALPKYSYFKRFQQEVIEERAKLIKTVLEFIAEHKLLFTSTDFVNFLQSGYPDPETAPVGTIAKIRSSLQLPEEQAPPLEYNSEDDSKSISQSANPTVSTDETDYSAISSIPIQCGFEIDRKLSPLKLVSPPSGDVSHADSFESLDSIDSGDLYSELEKITIPKPTPQIKKNVLPDLINFDAPSTSNFDDYHTMKADSDTKSETSRTKTEYTRSSSRVSERSLLSLSNASVVECKTKTEDSYVFEAGYMLNLAARYDDMKEYARAFECYKAGIEKMLIGVQSDTDPQRRALIKEKTNKYLSYAEAIYTKRLCDAEHSLLPEVSPKRTLHCPIPLSMVRRPYEELSLYRVLAVLGDSIMLVLHRGDQTCYAMKVIQKIPNNLTEFDEYFLQNTNETRQPILPTVIPYMVSLHSYIESNNLIFLILSYAPGEKLFDYIKNYTKSLPNTPAREVNLENVFNDPKIQTTESVNGNDFNGKTKATEVNKPALVTGSDEVDNVCNNPEITTTEVNEMLSNDSEISVLERITINDNINKTETKVVDSDVSELVLNSQKLLQNVEKALSGEGKVVELDSVNIKKEDGCAVKEGTLTTVERRVETPNFKLSPRPRAALPPSTVCRWGAQILTALESLHNSGVICRDLQPTNILLGEAGQIILTYFIYYPGLEMSLSKLQAKPGQVNMYIAPELYRYTYEEERDEVLERVCDFWSFGAVMFELICGVPLSYYHRSIFTTHTILQLPDGLPVEVQSLLTQLLTYEPSERLGGGRDGIEEIKRHPYFKSIDWQEIYEQWTAPG